MDNKNLNKDLRRKIIEVNYRGREGHIPSAFSIIDIISHLYAKILKVDPKNPKWDARDYFILSKGHGCTALYVVLARQGFITEEDLKHKSSEHGILGGHPDNTKVPGVEASTGSLGHGIGTALGLTVGLRIQGKNNRVFCMIGDGESNEGTVWECALVGSNLNLGNLCVIVDNNGSAAQILPVKNMEEKWRSFGWQVFTIDGHNQSEIEDVFQKLDFVSNGQPKVIIANTLKGKGVSFMEGHGIWHAKIPNEAEFQQAIKELS